MSNPTGKQQQLPQEIPDHWKFMDVKEVLETDAKPPPWKIEGLVAEGCGTLVSALPHATKSYSWLQAAMDAALGHKVWDHFDAGSAKRTLFIETEDPDWMVRQRVKELATGMNLKPDDIRDAGCFTIGCLGPFDLMFWRISLAKAIRKYKPDLTVLSTLQGLLGGRNWKEQADMAPINALLVKLALNESPLVTITHSPVDTRQKRAAGSVTIGANFPFHMHYQKRMNDDDEEHVIVRMDSKMGVSNGDSKFRLNIVSQKQPDSMRFVYEGGDSGTVRKLEISDYISRHMDDKATDIAKQFHVSDRYIRKLREELTI